MLLKDVIKKYDIFTIPSMNDALFFLFNSGFWGPRWETAIKIKDNCYYIALGLPHEKIILKKFNRFANKEAVPIINQEIKLFSDLKMKKSLLIINRKDRNDKLKNIKR